MLINKPLVLSVPRHHAQVKHHIMLLVLSSAGTRGAKGSHKHLDLNFLKEMNVLKCTLIGKVPQKTVSQHITNCAFSYQICVI